MFGEIRLHGHLNDTIEYYVTAAARDISNIYFYEHTSRGQRFFSPGNELILEPDRLRHGGNGGSFCEYMFGVDQPISDLGKPDVRNRLILYGATYKDGNGALMFTGNTEGVKTYEQIFFEGNAVYNYFFFLTGSVYGNLQEQQEGILRLLGKNLKRTSYVGDGNDEGLVEEILGHLGHKSTLYLVKLINKKHRQYHDHFEQLYLTYKSIPDTEFNELQSLADKLDIDRYQQERIRIDVMYKHPHNRNIVDEYKRVLLQCDRAGRISRQEKAHLDRLKTLSVRQKIPSALFFTLDEILKGGKVIESDEPGYLAESREILAGIFLQEGIGGANIDKDDMVRLLRAKKLASENRDHQFEQLLLETGKSCDEKIRDGADISLLESFSYIITYFDRFDSASDNIGQLAFMENVRLTEETIRSLLGNRREFNSLEEGLFDELFIDGFKKNRYLGRFGRRKLENLQKGLVDIENNTSSVHKLLDELLAINQEENLTRLVMAHVKDRVRNFYSRYNTSGEQQELRREVAEELRAKYCIQEEISEDLFNEVVVNIKKEAIYLHNILPQIISEKNIALREDFLDNSGLDRFYLEELEREYCEQNHIEFEVFEEIRKGSEEQ